MATKSRDATKDRHVLLDFLRLHSDKAFTPNELREQTDVPKNMVHRLLITCEDQVVFIPNRGMGYRVQWRNEQRSQLTDPTS
jgi:DNA-binding IclR family transcriptional regulator